MSHSVRPRPLRFTFSARINKHWFGNSPFKTHWLNSYTLIIPEGEKFILRSTKRYLDQVDGDLKEQVLGLLSQEALHSKEHERFHDNLRLQGYRIDGYLGWYRFISYRLLEHGGAAILGPTIPLSTAAAIEHINAVIAEIGLTRDFLCSADPELRALFEWHYAEEIEHKAVVYDVLNKVAPSYLLRTMGMVVATLTFVGALSVGTIALLWQDGQLINRKSLKEALQFFFIQPGFFFKYCSGLRAYLKRRFHPDERDNYYLAEQVFAAMRVR
jgi:predicted metal-dependent hydrolase